MAVAAAELVDIYVINNAEQLIDTVENKEWYTEPMGFVGVDTGEKIQRAESIEFHDDGTASVKSLAAEDFDTAGEDFATIKEETVDWEILGDRTLVLDGEKYLYKSAIFSSLGADITKNKVWYIEDDRICLGTKLYYDELKNR